VNANSLLTFSLACFQLEIIAVAAQQELGKEPKTKDGREGHAKRQMESQEEVGKTD